MKSQRPRQRWQDKVFAQKGWPSPQNVVRPTVEERKKMKRITKTYHVLDRGNNLRKNDLRFRFGHLSVRGQLREEFATAGVLHDEIEFGFCVYHLRRRSSFTFTYTFQILFTRSHVRFSSRILQKAFLFPHTFKYSFARSDMISKICLHVCRYFLLFSNTFTSTTMCSCSQERMPPQWSVKKEFATAMWG